MKFVCNSWEINFFRFFLISHKINVVKTASVQLYAFYVTKGKGKVGNLCFVEALRRSTTNQVNLNTLLLFQLDTLFYFPYIFTIFFLQFSLHVSDRLVHHQENQITRAASGPFPLFAAISCVAVGAN